MPDSLNPWVRVGLSGLSQDNPLFIFKNKKIDKTHSFFSIFSIFILLIIWRVSPLYTGEPTCVNPIPGMGQARLYISCLTKKVSQHGSIHFSSNPW